MGANLTSEPTKDCKIPFPVELQAGKKYGWCTCNRTKKQPFCDGAHKCKTKLRSLKFKVAETKTYVLCGCKVTKSPPYCDGAHNNLDW